MKEGSRWSDIFKHLESSGFEVYPPATKRGQCESPYLVVKEAGASSAISVSSTIVLYDIMLYVPQNSYSALEPLISDVENAMDGLWPMIRPTHFRTTPFLDEGVKGWMQSVQYENYRKNKRR